MIDLHTQLQPVDFEYFRSTYFIVTTIISLILAAVFVATMDKPRP